MGRLIDVDAFKKKVCTYQQTGCGDCKYSLCCPEDAPTVLTIPDNPTNGDIIKALFPNKQFVSICSNRIYDFTTDNKIDCDLEWWNAPYKAESEPQESEDDNAT